MATDDFSATGRIIERTTFGNYGSSVKFPDIFLWFGFVRMARVGHPTMSDVGWWNGVAGRNTHTVPETVAFL